MRVRLKRQLHKDGNLWIYQDSQHAYRQKNE